MFSTRDLKKTTSSHHPPSLQQQQQQQQKQQQQQQPVCLWSAEDENERDLHVNDDKPNLSLSYLTQRSSPPLSLPTRSSSCYNLRSSTSIEQPNQQTQLPLEVKKKMKAYKTRKSRKSTKSKEQLRKEIENLKKDFERFADAKASNESAENDDENENEDEVFDIYTIFRWIKNMCSYRLYKKEDINHMKVELAKHRALCQEMCQRSNFWKGKICHFVETGQENWNISDRYFVSLGQKNVLALE